MIEDGACSQCGLLYVRDDPADRRYHQRYHAAVLNGPRTTLSDGIYFISPRSNKRMRKLAYRAAQIAKRETKYDFPAFHPDEEYDPEFDTLALVKVENHRVVGLIVTCNRICRYLIQLSAFSDTSVAWRPLGDDEVPATPRRTIDMIWVARKVRGGGRAQELVDALCKSTKIQVGLLGHEIPFTPSALRFWQKLGLDRVYIAS